MNSSVSSAVPEKLIHYSDVTRELDATLQSTARRLRAQLEHFEARCVEPSFRLHVSGQADDLRSYANQCEPVDARVREVGQQFQIADRTMTVHSAMCSRDVQLTHIGDTQENVITSLTTLLKQIPSWLHEVVDSLPWIKQVGQSANISNATSETARTAAGLLDAIDPLLKNQQVFLDSIWKPLGRLVNQMAGNQHFGGVGCTTQLGKAIYQSPLTQLIKSGFSSTAIDGILNIVAERDYSLRGIGSGFTAAGLSKLLLAGEISIGNAVTQVEGAILIGSLGAIGQAIASSEWDDRIQRNTQRIYQALQDLDLEAIPNSIGNLIFGKGDLDDVTQTITTLPGKVWTFGKAWHAQIALTGIATGDRMYDAIMYTANAFKSWHSQNRGQL